MAKPKPASTPFFDVDPKAPRRLAHWISWFFGIALLGGVVYAALHLAQAEEFLRIGREAKPGWMALAFGLQALTYAAQGEIFCLVGRKAGSPVRRWFAYRLSLAKIFVDQAMPSGGLSGTALIAAALERGGMPRPAVAAAMVVDHATYYAAYVTCLGLALTMLEHEGLAHAAVFAVSITFCVFGTAFGAAFLALAGRAPSGRSGSLARDP